MGEPLLFVKYGGRKLNILDVEKKALTLKEPTQFTSNFRKILICYCFF